MSEQIDDAIHCTHSWLQLFGAAYIARSAPGERVFVVFEVKPKFACTYIAGRVRC